MTLGFSLTDRWIPLFNAYSCSVLVLLLASVNLSRTLRHDEEDDFNLLHPEYLNYSNEVDSGGGSREKEFGRCHYHNCETNEVVVQFNDEFDEDKMRQIGESHDYDFIGRVGGLKAYSFVRKDGRRVKRHVFQPLFDDPNVKWAEIQLPKRRVKRDLESDRRGDTVKLPWPDPLYTKQWYLRRGAIGGYDMKVREAWKLGYSGKNIVVSILDDGVQGSHPDLAANYDPMASKDINGQDDDPTPRDNGDNKHGTRCAGEVAAVAGNAWCGVGISYNAKIGGVRMLDGPVSDRVEGAALSHHQNHIDIYSASWGPDDDGQTFDGPGSLAKTAFYDGVTTGRKGKGNIFIWASGNGGSYQDSCSCDGYTTSIFTLSVSSATFDNRQPWYLEECPSTLCTTYSSANRGQPAIVTTDMPNSCTEVHTGTSASAPIAAAIVALALEANGNLTWRDMQHLVIRTSNPTALLANPGWTTNAVGRKVSNKFGYGLMDAEALVKMAKLWKTVPPHRACTFQHKMAEPDPLRGRFVKNYTLFVSGRCLHSKVLYLEHVQSLVSVQFQRRGDLQIVLTSPMGTRSTLLPQRPRDDFRSGFQKWPFMSVQQWGENPEGEWTLSIQNMGNGGYSGAFHDWSLTLYGTDAPPQPNDPSNSEHAPSNAPIDNNNNNGNNQIEQASAAGVPTDQLDASGLRHHEVEFPRQTNLRESPPLDGVVSNGGGGGADDDGDARGNGGSPSSVSPDGGATLFSSTSLTNGNSDNNNNNNNIVGAVVSSSASNFLDLVRLFGDGREKILHVGCHKECDPGGCYVQNSAQECVACKNFQQFLRNRGGVKCVEKCDGGYYADLEAKRCNQCVKGCATCSSAEYCDSCPAGTLLVDIDPEHFHHGKCLAHCPQGFVNVTDDGKSVKCVAVCGKNCLTCKDDTQCRYCKENYFMSPARQCLPSCPEAFFANKENRKCEECLPRCNKCRDKTKCLECAADYVWNSTLSTCDLEQRKSCRKNKDCPSGQYCEASDSTCQVCHTDCLECIGPAFDHCLSCRNGQPMDTRTKQCLPCHSGQYFNVITGECSPCDKSCAVCLGVSRTQCTKCNKGYKQLSSLCEPCCTKANSRSHGIYCVTCLDQVDQDDYSPLGILPKSSGQLLKVIVILVVSGIVVSLLIMAYLMCRDRNYTSGAKKYAYSKLATTNNIDLGENKFLLKPGSENTANDNKYSNLYNHLLEGEESSEDDLEIGDDSVTFEGPVVVGHLAQSAELRRNTELAAFEPTI